MLEETKQQWYYSLDKLYDSGSKCIMIVQQETTRSRNFKSFNSLVDYHLYISKKVNSGYYLSVLRVLY